MEMDGNLSPALKKSCDRHSEAARYIDNNRKRLLYRLAAYIRENSAIGTESKLLFVCTHNSRRSQFAQVWFHTAMIFYGLKRCKSYSGGTEVTAVYPETANSLERSGFEVSYPQNKISNSAVKISFAEKEYNLELFSKLISGEENPSVGFAAVMVCSSADEACPFVPGADLRVSLPYDDPGAFDRTPAMSSEYDKASSLIASEMFYLAWRVAEAGE